MTVNSKMHISLTDGQKKLYSSISSENLKFFDYIKNRPSFFKLDNFHSLKFPVGDSILSPWPVFLSPCRYEEFKQVALQLGRIITEMPYGFFKGNSKKVSEYFRVSREDAGDWLRYCNSSLVKDVFLRGDFILTKTGLKCIEMNGGAALGGWQLPFFEKIMLSNKLIKQYFETRNMENSNTDLLETCLRHILECIIKARGIPGESMNIVIADMNKSKRCDQLTYFNSLYKKVLIENNFLPESGKVLILRYKDMIVKRGKLMHKSLHIKAVVDLTLNIPAPVNRLADKKMLVLFNGDISYFLCNKLNIAFLSENTGKGFFSRKTDIFLRKHIPWTRRLDSYETYFKNTKGNLRDIAFKFKDKLVIKSSIESSGIEVYIGKKTSIETWEKVIKKALRQKDWIMQELLEPVQLVNIDRENRLAQFNSVWGLLTFGRHFGGALLRILPDDDKKGLVNSNQGADISVVFKK